MTSVSGILPGTLRTLAAAGAAEEPAPPQPVAPERDRTPWTDTYIPGQAEPPSGRYWIGRGEDGSPEVRFDGPVPQSPAPDHPEPPEGPEPDAAEPPEAEGAPGRGRKAECCTGNTDAVDREIERLKQKKACLEQQLNAEPDGQKRETLERRLEQVENELRQKDNDAYRRLHTRFS